MYEAFYGLSHKPFQLNPDPAFYYDSKQHRRAKAYLDYGVMRHEGFIVITGEVGAGKTTILSSLLKRLDPAKVTVGQLVTTQLDAEDTLRMVGAAFGVRVTDMPKSQLLITLEAFLIGQATQGKRCLLVVDEAQNLTARAVEELRMLSNYQLGTRNLLQTFLVGQPEFRDILQRPEMEQFRQRVSASCHLGPLDLEDTRAYIRHRLQCAGSTGKPEFDDEAFALIFKESGGVPRRINQICDRVLLLGYIQNKQRLGEDEVQQVMVDLSHESAVAAKAAAPGTTAAQRLAMPDLDQAEIDAGLAQELSAKLASLSLEQQGDRLLRLERGLQRLEHINLQTLAALQDLIKALRKTSDEPAP